MSSRLTSRVVVVSSLVMEADAAPERSSVATRNNAE